MKQLDPLLQPDMLEHRPEARAFKIEDLMQQIRLGRLRIPTFQRRLAWDRHDARRLVDSLYRGYPVGTLLFWETESQAERIQWGSLQMEVGQRTDALLVVDGQQRLVSLARILLTSDQGEEDFGLFFDLDKRRFEFVSGAVHVEEDPARWLPLNRVLDSERLFEWLYEHATSKERREQAILLGKRLREYDIPAYVVRSGSDATLREIFGRLNSTGKRLSDAEVFDALNGARSGHRPASLKDMARALAGSMEFGLIDEDLLHRLLRVLHGIDVIPGGNDEPLRLKSEQAAELFAQTEQMAASVIRFIRHDAGIPHFELMPYKQPLVTLGKFFRYHPEPRPRSRELLSRWLWRGAIDGSHTGNTVSTRAALELIDPADEEGSVQRLLDMVSAQPKDLPGSLDRFNFRFAASKLLALALLDLGPRDLRTGERMDIGLLLDRRQTTSGQRQDPPFVTILAGNAAVPTELLQSVANRLAHPAMHGLRRQLMDVDDPMLLASHGIDAQAHLALRAGDSAGFLRLRAQVLEAHLEQVLARHAQWGATDRPSIAALIVSDDEAEVAQ